MVPNTESKKKIGFRTSALELQDKFEEIFKQARSNKEAWNKTQESIMAAYKDFRVKTKAKSEPETARYRSIVSFFLVTQSLISIIGVHLSDIEEHLVTCEKSIDKLHLKIK